MGFAVPAAIGAKVGRPDAMVYAIDGDGCFQMTSQELITAATERIPIKVAVLNNSGYGMVRQWQTLFYDGRYSAIDLGDEVPDYVKLAEAMGCVAMRATSPEDVRPVIDKSISIDDRPVVVEFKVDPDEMCFPMVPAGGSNDDVVLGPEGLR
jgi:acetolactate synthase-1/2/3 large subunit